MTWLASKLKHKIQIQEPLDTANATGGFTRGYKTIATIWAVVGTASTRSMLDYVESIKGENVRGRPAHEFTVRMSAIKNLGKSFTNGFDTGFDTVSDINPIKKDMFIFLQKSSADVGRRFQIVGARHDDNNSEFSKIRAREMEEIGTGWPE